ncbi:MAG TPA: ribosome biogenesis GTP-binding protein YihA/YsxC [Burkholderiaceae bacterium]
MTRPLPSRKPSPSRASAADKPASTKPAAAPAPGSAPAAPSPARQALGWLHTTRFLTSASRIEQLPQGDMPEIAFVGRSNAGKSSAINTLAQQRQLAFASKTPGRTQLINLFALGPKDAPEAYLADLPGYGYAAVDRGKKLVWQKVMADYLEVRRALLGVVLMVDSRHGFTPLDQRLLDFVAQRVRTGEVKLLVLLTKADKLTKTEAKAAVDAAQEVLGEFVTEASDIGVTPFSSLRRTGVEDVAETLRAWVDAAPERVEFELPPPSADGDVPLDESPQG